MLRVVPDDEHGFELLCNRCVLTRLVPGTTRLSTMFMIVIKVVTVTVAVVVIVVVFITIVVIVGCNGKRTNQRLGGM